MPPQFPTPFSTAPAGGRPQTAISSLLSPKVVLIGATDTATGGDILATRLAELAASAGAKCDRMLPPNGAKDWTEALVRRSAAARQPKAACTA